MLDGQVKSNARLLVLTLKPFAERKDAALSAERAHRAGFDRQGQAIREANVIFYNLPPIIGLGTGSGFEYQLLSMTGAPAADIAAVARGLVFAANQNPALQRVFTTFSRQHAAALSRHRPRQGADARHRGLRCLQHAAGGARQRLCQRLQPVRPHLAGDRAGRGVGPHARSTTSTGSTCATTRARWCRSAPSPRRA